MRYLNGLNAIYLKIMKHYSIDQIRRVLRNRGYKFFKESNYDLNLIFIRSKNSQSDMFDDLAVPIWRESGGITCRHFECTTDPGKHWLLTPLNQGGTIITVPGQYRSSHKMGYHNKSRGKTKMYRAFEQVGDLKYVRDNNRDADLDFSLIDDKNNWIQGNCHTNIHRASRWKSLANIGLYSAGCTVLRNPWDFDFLIDLGLKQIDMGLGDLFTFTLLKEEWFN